MLLNQRNEYTHIFWEDSAEGIKVRVHWRDDLFYIYIWCEDKTRYFMFPAVFAQASYVEGMGKLVSSVPGEYSESMAVLYASQWLERILGKKVEGPNGDREPVADAEQPHNS